MPDGLMPGIPFRQVVNRSPGGMRRPILGQVLHHIVGDVPSAEARFNHPSSQASAHFGVAYNGQIVQWVSVNDRAWHAARFGEGANYQWVGVENESPSTGDDLFPPLTAEQVAANARILAWLHDTEGVPLQVTDDPTVGGVAYHHMDPSWGLTGCPGDAIIAQRQAIVDAATGTQLAKGVDMIYKAVGTSTTNPAVVNGSLWVIVGQFPGGTLLVHGEETAAAYPACPVVPVDGEQLGKISKFSGAGGAGSASVGPWTIKLAGTAQA